jgi:deoxyribodipyrimidine photo-lyase
VVGAAGLWWLHQSLQELSAALAERGIILDVRTGDTEKVLAEAVSDYGAVAVFWNRRYAPSASAV